jgi:hypothetical protein
VAANFLVHFNELKDPRMAGKVRYPLGEVLLRAVASTVSDGDGFVDMEDYGKEKLQALRQFLPYRHGVPTHGQLGYIFAKLDGEAFRRCFVAWKKAGGGLRTTQRTGRNIPGRCRGKSRWRRMGRRRAGRAGGRAATRA